MWGAAMVGGASIWCASRGPRSFLWQLRSLPSQAKSTSSQCVFCCQLSCFAEIRFREDGFYPLSIHEWFWFYTQNLTKSETSTKGCTDRMGDACPSCSWTGRTRSLVHSFTEGFQHKHSAHNTQAPQAHIIIFACVHPKFTYVYLSQEEAGNPQRIINESVRRHRFELPPPMVARNQAPEHPCVGSARKEPFGSSWLLCILAWT